MLCVMYISSKELNELTAPWEWMCGITIVGLVVYFFWWVILPIVGLVVLLTYLASRNHPELQEEETTSYTDPLGYTTRIEGTLYYWV